MPTFKLRRLRDRSYSWDIELEADSLADLVEWDLELRRKYGGDVVACTCYIDERRPLKRHRVDCPLADYPLSVIAVDLSRAPK